MDKNEIILYETADHAVKLNVNTDGETVWLNRAQLAELFDRDVKTIGKHINNALKEELSSDNSTVAKFATVQTEGDREVTRDIEYYNLDVIISVGYRVKSQRGVEFRKWANKVLKDYNMIYTYHYTSPLGGITLAGDGESLTGLWFDGQKYFPHKLISESTEAELPIFTQTSNWLDIYFGGKIPDFTPPVRLQTTPFRKAVYDILLTIPYGHTMTYGEIANIIAKAKGTERMSAQAVGGAVGHNPVSIIIPCHRVVGADGSLTGYAGGLDKKTALLNLEKR